MPTNNGTLKVLRTGDAKSAFGVLRSADILGTYGPPTSLLSTSAKIDKCAAVNVLARILYLTPGVFCPAATSGCLNSCLGHSSGRMTMPTHSVARDRRTALYIENRGYFLARLNAELQMLELDAQGFGWQAAARLNGSSDIMWERLHPELLDEFPRIHFFDYTKILGRMHEFLGIRKRLARTDWPTNYHLTFSGDRDRKAESQRILHQGGNVALAFWPEPPRSWWGFPVIDGDAHDARFLDESGSIVGLRAKGAARVDLSGFTLRPCPSCNQKTAELSLVTTDKDTHRSTHHRCQSCGFEIRARCKVAA